MPVYARKSISVYWELYINGEIIGDTRRKCIKSIEVQSLIDGSDLLTLNINDPALVFMEDNIFIEDATVHLDLYFSGNPESESFDGFVIAFDGNFSEDGIPMMTLYCMDNTHIMNRKKVKKTWKGKTRLRVVSDIAKKYGYKLEYEKGYKFRSVKSIVQNNITDIEMIEKMAKDEPELFYAKVDTARKVVMFKKIKVASKPDATILYKEAPYDLMGFTPQITKETIQLATNDSSIRASSGDQYGESYDPLTEGLPNTTTSPVGDSGMSDKTYNRETGKWE